MNAVEIAVMIAEGKLPEGWTMNEQGHILDTEGRRVGRNGRRLGGAAGRPLTEEAKAELAAAREKAKAEGKRMGGSTRRITARDTFDATIERLEPKALRELEETMDDEHASRKDKLTAALNVLAYRRGKPVAKIEQETVEVVRYELAEHEPAPVTPLRAVPDEPA